MYHPEPDQLLRELHGEDLLQGVVVDLSQGATPATSFAVVRVDELRAPLIVALNRITEVV